jgi:hypothetical protein
MPAWETIPLIRFNRKKKAPDEIPYQFPFDGSGVQSLKRVMGTLNGKQHVPDIRKVKPETNGRCHCLEFAHFAPDVDGERKNHGKQIEACVTQLEQICQIRAEMSGNENRGIHAENRAI